MPNGIDELLLTLNQYKNKEKRKLKDETFIKKIDNLIELINQKKYINDFNNVEDIVKRYETIETDSKLVEIMLNVNRYNVYLMNKNIKYIEPDLEKDIELNDVKVDLDDILKYLEVDINELNKDLVKDLNKYSNKDKFTELATFIKGSEGLEYILYDKIKDKNILISILLHSNKEIITSVINILKNEASLVNKVIPNIPFIFIKEKINTKCNYNIPCMYDNFKENINLLNKNNINIKDMLNYPIFFINDFNKNNELIEKLKDLNVNIKNILTHVGNIVVNNIDIIIKNINLLNYHKIELTDDDNNNGYTILGMRYLAEKIDYLIETNKWKKSLGLKHDNIDLIRALIIKDNYINWKNNTTYNLENDISFNNKEINDDIIEKIYQKYPILNKLDEKYLYEFNYRIKDVFISKHRLLSNLYNYIGINNPIIESLKYKTYINKEDLNKVIDTINEMSDI